MEASTVLARWDRAEVGERSGAPLEEPAALLRSRVDGRFFRNLLRLGFLAEVDLSSSEAARRDCAPVAVVVVLRDNPAMRESRLASEALRVDVLIEPERDEPGEGLT